MEIRTAISNNGKIYRSVVYTHICALNNAGLPKLTYHQLSVDNPISFLGLSIRILPDNRLLVSQPGYIEAIVTNFPSLAEGKTIKPRESPLPANFSTRTLTSEQQESLKGQHSNSTSNGYRP